MNVQNCWTMSEALIELYNIISVQICDTAKWVRIRYDYNMFHILVQIKCCNQWMINPSLINLQDFWYQIWRTNLICEHQTNTNAGHLPTLFMNPTLKKTQAFLTPKRSQHVIMENRSVRTRAHHISSLESLDRDSLLDLIIEGSDDQERILEISSMLKRQQKTLELLAIRIASVT